MSIIVTQHPNRHRPEPIREAIVLQRKNADYRSSLQRKVMGIHFDTGHLSHVIVRQTGLIVISIGNVTTQIPIDLRLL
ncbi:hypothetical protein [Candidatus Nitrotoga sp. 1052]|uniref:hypothetical protein n=1 Tax=Candidatus Nitrotoga sp. 1052 TaxID=2886964 RepID=UPI001EF6D977|nr:hypothetical protein [Candidatus Nitrotoga sp. 1052]